MSDAEPRLRAFLVDDEALALKRLGRLLEATGRVEIIGSTTDPAIASQFLASEKVDVLFLDIQMPGMNGFELLAQLPTQPIVIFVTAYNEYALQAFQVNSIDYLLKPVEPQQLDRALRKIKLLRGNADSLMMRSQLQSFLANLVNELPPAQREFPDRICSHVGDRMVFIDLNSITHFFSEDKLTFAATEGRQYIVDYTIGELEQKLASKGFARIHRATLINLALIDELHRWFGGRLLARLKDKKRTELMVARNHVKTLKEKLGLLR
jgi:two-component system, LytTR family, response regulator